MVLIPVRRRISMYVIEMIIIRRAVSVYRDVFNYNVFTRNAIVFDVSSVFVYVHTL